MKEWWEQEVAYQAVYAAGRQAQNLWKYIPDKLMDCVEDAVSDSDGYWIYLDEDHVAYDGGEDCRIIHCYSIKDLKADIKTIRKKGE